MRWNRAYVEELLTKFLQQGHVEVTLKNYTIAHSLRRSIWRKATRPGNQNLYPPFTTQLHKQSDQTCILTLTTQCATEQQTDSSS